MDGIGYAVFFSKYIYTVITAAFCYGYFFKAALFEKFSAIALEFMSLNLIQGTDVIFPTVLTGDRKYCNKKYKKK